MHRVSALKNGAHLITVPFTGTRATTVLVLFPVGSRYEDKKISGASHFVEHLMFKGTANRPTAQDISRVLDAAGAEYNAFTGKDHTGYYVKIDGEKQELAFDLLSDMVFASRLDAAEIEKEKGVIVEELRMYEDNPIMAVEQLFDRVVFGEHPLGRDIGGTVASVRAVTREGLWRHYRGAYNPANMVLVVAGKIDARLKKNLRYFEKVKLPGKFNKNKFSQFAWRKKTPALADRVAVSERKVDQSQVVLGFPGLKNNHPDRYAASVLMNILGGSMSSRLFVEVREKRGLAYVVRAGMDAYRDTGVARVHAGLDPARLSEAIAVIREELHRIANEPVSSKELADAKTNFTGRMALVMEDSSAQADWFAKQFWFANKIQTYEEVLNKINKVTAADVQKLARRLFVWDNVRVAVIGPVTKAAVLKML